MRSLEPARFGVTSYAPGSIGNLGPGLDVLACALTGAGDTVHAWFTDGNSIAIVEPGHPDLPRACDDHACGIAALEVRARVGATSRGIAISVQKGLPLSAGQGGSGASAIAAAVAVNELLSRDGYAALDTLTLLDAALASESRLAGRHLDNLAASLFGGVVCVRQLDPSDVVQVPVNMEPWFALAHPSVRVRTADARAVLPENVSRNTLVAQLANVAALVTALSSGDFALLGRALDDHVAEAPRSHLVPGFANAKQAALAAGALGVSLSGSGPTTFAACRDESTAHAAAEAMRWAFEAAGVSCHTRIATVDREGARSRWNSEP